MNSIKSALKQIPTWRWIFVFILIIGISYQVYSNTSPTFFELLLVNINDPSPIILYLIFLLLIADYGYKREEKEKLSDLNITLKYIYHNYLFSALISIVFLVLLIAGDFITLLFNARLNFSNEWLTMEPLFRAEWLKPLTATIILIPLFFFEFMFITMVIFTVNILSKQLPFGYLGGFAICLINAIAYHNLQAIEILRWILPFGYSCLESVLNHTKDIFMNIIISILYWLVLILVIGLIIPLISKIQKKKRKGGICIEQNHTTGY